MNHSNFDKKGFLFFLKFVFFLFILIFAGRYGTEFFSSDLHLANINQSQKIKQTALLIALKQLDTEKEIEPETPQPQKLTLGFVGDIMLDRGIKSNVIKYGDDNYDYVFEKIKDYLNNFDVLFGNLEGPISDNGKKVGSKYSFRMDTDVTQPLKDAGFDVLSLANNHMGDWSKIAMKDTFKNLEDVGIIYSGGGKNKEEAYEIKTVEKNDTKIAYLSFSQFGKGYLEAGEDTAGIAIISDEKLKYGIEKAKTENDVVIVSFHFGDEYKKEPNAYQKTFARKAVDYGSDLVIGHHPHVVETIEKYKDKYIAYSLGNFVFDQHFSKETMEGIVLKATVEDKKITDVLSDKITINKYYQPELATESSE